MTICNPSYPPCRNPGMGASAAERYRYGAPMSFPRLQGNFGEVTATQTVWAGVSLASAALCTYHGYKRNQSIGWALVWGFLGTIFPIVTPAIAVAQGFGKRR